MTAWVAPAEHQRCQQGISIGRICWGTAALPATRPRCGLVSRPAHWTSLWAGFLTGPLGPTSLWAGFLTGPLGPSLWAGFLTGPLGPTAGFLHFLETCGRAGVAVVKPRHNRAATAATQQGAPQHHARSFRSPSTVLQFRRGVAFP